MSPQAKKASSMDPELRLQPTITRRDDTWQRIPLRSELTEKEAHELVKLNPSFNQYVLIPDPVPRSHPTSPILPSPTFSHFSHASSPLLNSQGSSPSLSIPVVSLSRQNIKHWGLQGFTVPPCGFDHHSVASSHNGSSEVMDIGTSMTGDWEGEFRAVPIEKALLMNISNPNLENVGLQRTRQLRMQGSERNDRQRQYV
jgi:hypothetical protein